MLEEKKDEFYAGLDEVYNCFNIKVVLGDLHVKIGCKDAYKCMGRESKNQISNNNRREQ